MGCSRNYIVGCMLMSVMDSQNRIMKTVRETSHEGIPKLAEVSTIVNFFSKDVGGIDFASNIKNLWRVILDPFPNGVLKQFDVTSGLGCHIACDHLTQALLSS
jgi:hypothetical protein